MAAVDLTAARLRDLLKYDPQTGEFVWVARSSPKSRVIIGAIAGSMSEDGYWAIMIDKRMHRAHRLAWLYTYGTWPEEEIDHIDGVRINNMICNLRDVTRSVNQQNLKRTIRTARPRTASQLGVSKKHNRWKAGITVQGRTLHLGLFLTEDAAHQAYLEAKRRLHAGCTI